MESGILKIDLFRAYVQIVVPALDTAGLILITTSQQTSTHLLASLVLPCTISDALHMEPLFHFVSKHRTAEMFFESTLPESLSSHFSIFSFPLVVQWCVTGIEPLVIPSA